MSDITMEQKLQLIRQIRSRYRENQYDMSTRERIILGKDPLAASPASDEGSSSELQEHISLFKVRLFLAILFFLAVVVMDKNDINVAGITPEKIFRVISADYEEKIDEWMETFAASYNSPQR